MIGNIVAGITAAGVVVPPALDVEYLVIAGGDGGGGRIGGGGGAGGYKTGTLTGLTASTNYTLTVGGGGTGGTGDTGIGSNGGNSVFSTGNRIRIFYFTCFGCYGHPKVCLYFSAHVVLDDRL